MAYFHCLIGGGSSGGGYELTVTCDADFAGTTITATDGVTTLTQTCPSASPYEVVFEIPNGGDWTISGTISGDVYSTSINIPSSLELHYISTPEGSTVLPTDDIQTWLACANITDKSYTTIGEVLADATTLLALISDNNAVDYMVRSTTWASSVCANSDAMTDISANNYCASTLLNNATWRDAIRDSTYFETVLNTKVPTMTSDTTPSGECSAGNLYSGRYAYYAFSGSSSAAQQCITTGTGEGSRITYDFKKKVMCLKGSFTSYNSRVRSYKIQGSNDGANWTDLTGTLTNYSFNITNPDYFKMYSLVPLANNTNNSVALLQYYGRDE